MGADSDVFQVADALTYGSVYTLPNKTVLLNYAHFYLSVFTAQRKLHEIVKVMHLSTNKAI